jgi:uncharacterized protein YjdB
MSIPVTSISSIVTSPVGVIEVHNNSNVYNGTIQLYANVAPINATNQTIIWSSSNKNIATVSSEGLVTSVFKGPVTITATTQDGSYSTSYNLKIMMGGVSFGGTLYFSTAIGTNILYVGETGYVTGYTGTGSPKFVSSNTSVLTVDTYTGAYNVVGTGTVSVTITDYVGTTMLTSVTCTSYNTITSSYIANTTNPNDKFNIISVGSSISIEAKNSPAGSVINWSSDNTAYATVTSTGDKTATVAGITAHFSNVTTVTITGYNGGWVYNLFVRIPAVRVTGITGSATGTVYTSAAGSAGLTVQPTTASKLMTLYAIPSDPTILMPTSGNLQVIGLKPGVASVTYTTADGGYTFTKTYTVNGKNPTETIYTTGISSITTPGNARSLLLDSTLALTASATPSNATNKTISWSSSNISVATVSSLGVVSGISTGSVRITASTADGFTSTIDLTVTYISVTGISAISGGSSVTGDSTITLSASVTPGNATNQTIMWSSDASGVASVDASGVVSGVSAGTATITATTANGGFTATKSITVTKPVTGISAISGDSSVTEGSTITLSASVTPGDATNQTITWSSDASGVAYVDPSGVVTGVSAGTATITATTADGSYTATKSIDVIPSFVAVTGVTLDDTAFTKYVGETMQLTATVSPADATNTSITWASLNELIATVDEYGIVTAVGAGSTTIIATASGTNFSASATATIEEPVTDFTVTTESGSNSLRIGGTTQMLAGYLPEGSIPNSITWASQDTSLATVDASGLVTCVTNTIPEIGYVTIECIVDTYPSPITKTVSLSILYPFTGFAPAGLVINDETNSMVEIQRGDEININHTQTIEIAYPIIEGTALANDITISSSNTDVLTVRINQGEPVSNQFNVVGTGETILSVSAYGSTITRTITVVDEPFVGLTGFDVAAENNVSPTVAQGGTIQLVATPVPANASYSSPYWELVSTTSSGASVDTYTGVVTTGSTTGEIVVKAYYGTNITQEFTVTVTEAPPALTGLDITYDYGANDFSTFTQYMGIDLQFYVSPIPSNAVLPTITWTSSDDEVSTVDSNGYISPLTAGQVTITASIPDGSISVSSVGTILQSAYDIIVTSGYNVLRIGQTLQLTATPVPSNAAGTFLWSSNDDTIATVDISGLVTCVTSTAGLAAVISCTMYSSSTVASSVTLLTVNEFTGFTTPVLNIIDGANGEYINAGDVININNTSAVSFGVGIPTNEGALSDITYSSSNIAVLAPQTDKNGNPSVDTFDVVGAGTTIVTAAAYGIELTQTITVVDTPFVALTGFNVATQTGATTIIPGSTLQLTSTPVPSDATYTTPYWYIVSTTSEGASIDQYTGVLTAGSTDGEVVVRASYGENISQEFTVTVSTAPPVLTGLDITYDYGANDFSTFTQYMGIDLQFYVSPIPSNAVLPTITWTSSNDEVSTVDSNGYISPLTAGQVTITASTPDGSITVSSVGTILQSATDIIVTSGYNVLRIGQTLQLTATPVPSNAAGTIVWSSDDDTIATVDISGLVTCVTSTAGLAAIIRCTMYSSSTVSSVVTLLTVNEFTGFTTPVLNINDGANGEYINAGDVININNTSTVSFGVGIPTNEGALSDITYSSSNIAVLAPQTDKNGNPSVDTFDVVGAGTTIVTAAAYGTELTQTITVVDTPFVALTGFNVATQTGATTIIPGSTIQLTSTPVPSDATYTTPYWYIVSTTSEGASIDQYTGVLTAGSTDGEVVVRASYGENISQEFTVTIGDLGIAVTGISAITAAGDLTYVAPASTLQLSATISPSDASNKTINWTSSDPNKATVDASGVVSGLALGDVTITARSAASNEFSSTYELRIGVPVSGINGISGASSVLKGRTTQLTTSVTPSNAAVTGITWTSSAPEVATVDPTTGVVTGFEGGSTTITATTAEGSYSTTHALTVIVFPEEVTGISDPSGNLNTLRVPLGGTVQFSGVFVPTNTTNKNMVWQSSNPSVATVDASGLVTGVAVGVIAIVGKSVENLNLQRTATVRVYIPVTGMNPITHANATDEVLLGARLQLSCEGVIPSDAENGRYTWSTSHPEYIEVTRSRLLAVNAAMPDNSFTVTATSEDGGFTATRTFTIYRPIGAVGSITATNRAIAVALNNTIQLTLPILPANATTQTVTWTSSNSSKISVSSTGLCTGVDLTQKKEAITITASIREPSTNVTFTRTYPLIVPVNKITGLNAITAVGAPSICVNGQSYQLLTGIVPSTASYANLGYTWSSSNPAIAIVDSTGLMSVVGPGKNVKITATAVGDLTGAKKKVSRVFPVITYPSSIQSPVATSSGGYIVGRGKKIKLMPVVVPTTATNTKVTFTSSDPAIATVTTKGDVTGKAAGAATITITSIGLSSVTRDVRITVF